MKRKVMMKENNFFQEHRNCKFLIKSACPFMRYSLLTWQHPDATGKLFIALCIGLLASLLLKGPTLFMLIGKMCFHYLIQLYSTLLNLF